jgi:hypothetical protein
MPTAVEGAHDEERVGARAGRRSAHGGERTLMDPTRSQEPNHSQLTAEGNACDLHHTSTGQWSLTHNTESDAGLPEGNARPSRRSA